MILELHRQGLSVSAIARRLDLDRKTVRKYIARGLEPPAYGPRAPRPQRVDAYLEFLRDRLRAFPGLTAARLLREIKPLGFTGGYSTVKEAVRALRPAPAIRFEHRFETVRIPSKPDTRSDDDGHPRSIATQAGQLFIRLSALGQGGGRFAHRFAGSKLDAVRIVDQPVEDGISDSPAPEVLMPVGHGQL